MNQLQKSYPDLVELKVAEKEFGLQSKLMCGRILHIVLITPLVEPCNHHYLRIFNRRLHGSNSTVPQLFLSGELHGDERLGPNAIMELAIFLLQNRAYFDTTYCKNRLISISSRFRCVVTEIANISEKPVQLVLCSFA